MYKKVSLLIISSLALTGCSNSMDAWGGEANYVNLLRDEDLAGDELVQARVDLKVGTMEIEPAPNSKLYEVDFHYNELAFTPVVELTREGTKAQLSVCLEGEGKSFRRLGENVLNLKLNPNTPLELESHTGVGESNIDLGGMNIRNLNLQSGVGETTISVLEPNQSSCDRVEITGGVGSFEVVGLGNLSFGEFEFSGGVGEAKLDFSGEWNEIGDVVVEVGVGGVELLLPNNVGAKIRVSKGFFSEFNFSDFRKEGDTYYSNNLDQVDKVIKMQVRAGIGGVKIRWL